MRTTASASATSAHDDQPAARQRAATFRTGQVAKYERRQVHDRSPGSKSSGGPVGITRVRQAARVAGRVKNQSESAG